MFTNIVINDFLVQFGVTLILGIAISFAYMHKHRYNKNFAIQLAILPLMVMAVISLVNGNVGTGLAVMGAFSLVRFRSIPGTSKDIGFIFISMAIGLSAGMNYLDYAVVFTILIIIAYLFISSILIKDNLKDVRLLKITVAEDVDYMKVFNEVFKKYTKEYKLIRVKTTNMGSMIQLSYDILLKDNLSEKKMIDELRIRNGNLNISLGLLNLGNEVL